MLYLVHKALAFRRENRSLFEQGEYLPLTAEGMRAGHTCAFARKLGGKCLVAAVPRFLTRLISGGGSLPFGRAVWEDTCLLLPGISPGAQFRNIITREIIVALEQEGKTVLALADAYASFPAAMLELMA
jgi:(1->4)-alpha-D-glucan 1-alpha-D-glucosylmutase